MEKPNLQYIEELSGGDKDFEAKLKKVVKNEFPLEYKTYQANMQISAFAKAAENVHKIKHKLGILGMEKAYEFAMVYEEELRNADLQNSQQFDDVLTQVFDFVKDF